MVTAGYGFSFCCILLQVVIFVSLLQRSCLRFLSFFWQQKKETKKSCQRPMTERSLVAADLAALLLCCQAVVA